MDNQEKRAVILTAAKEAVKLLANGAPAHVDKVGKFSDSNINLQPIIQNAGPTESLVERFVVQLANVLTNDYPDSGIEGQISVEETQGTFFAQISFS
jgi:hypothetical protein